MNSKDMKYEYPFLWLHFLSTYSFSLFFYYAGNGIFLKTYEYFYFSLAGFQMLLLWKVKNDCQDAKQPKKKCNVYRNPAYISKRPCAASLSLSLLAKGGARHHYSRQAE